MKRFSRRSFLAEGARMLTVAGPAAMATWLGWPGAAQAQDWGSLFRGKPSGGHGTVKKMAGRASANGRLLRQGERVQSGEEIWVYEDSWVILSLSDNTILRINARTVFTMNVGRRNSGLLKLLAGAVLTVMPKTNRYLVQMPTATIGIKGTVFYHQIFYPDERTATDYDEKEVILPEGIDEYFCLCNGLADFLPPGLAQPYFSDRAAYHNSYFIDSSQLNPLVKAPQINHTDRQIWDLIDTQDGEKHDSSWLKKYYDKYDPDKDYDR